MSDRTDTSVADATPEASATAPPPLTVRQRLSLWDVKVSPYLYVLPFFVVFAAIGLYPMLYTGYLSFFDWQPLSSEHGDFVGLGNYTDVLDNPVFTKALFNTISIFLLSSVPQVIIATIVAALLDSHLRAKAWWRMSVILPFIVAPAAVALIFGGLFADKSGLINEVLGAVGLGPFGWHVDRLPSHLAIATMVNWRWTGYNALIILAAMQAVPRDLYESASLDGAGRVRQFWSVTLPMIRPTMLFIIITSTIGGLQIFTEPRLFDTNLARQGGADYQFTTLTMFVFNVGRTQGFYGRAAAAAWLLFLLIVLIALINFLLTRYFARRRTP